MEQLDARCPFALCCARIALGGERLGTVDALRTRQDASGVRGILRGSIRRSATPRPCPSHGRSDRRERVARDIPTTAAVAFQETARATGRRTPRRESSRRASNRRRHRNPAPATSACAQYGSSRRSHGGITSLLMSRPEASSARAARRLKPMVVVVHEGPAAMRPSRIARRRLRVDRRLRAAMQQPIVERRLPIERVPAALQPAPGRGGGKALDPRASRGVSIRRKADPSSGDSSRRSTPGGVRCFVEAMSVGDDQERHPDRQHDRRPIAHAHRDRSLTEVRGKIFRRTARPSAELAVPRRSDRRLVDGT